MIICVPFDVDVFWVFLELGTVIAGVGLFLEVGRMYQGTNARRKLQ